MQRDVSAEVTVVASCERSRHRRWRLCAGFPQRRQLLTDDQKCFFRVRTAVLRESRIFARESLSLTRPDPEEKFVATPAIDPCLA